jgi:hypothetical protein
MGPTDHSVRSNPDLHLAVNIRSNRARIVSDWVKLILESNANGAAKLFSATSEFPVVLTRDLEVARNWLRARTEGAQDSGVSGLLASSGALRLRAYGLEVSSGFRHGYPYDDWFLRTRSDVRSCSSLEVVASEFECQGLEVDWAGVCWGDDVVFNPEARTWDTRKFVGARWLTTTNPIIRKYILNKYRVLLTRARRGIVIWVPPGSATDPTRRREMLDSTAGFLSACGVSVI